MARTARRHYFTSALLGLFSLVFAAFLGVAAYYYFQGAEGMDIKSFAPGLPAFFLFFMARKEWRSARAARNMERRRRKKAGAVAGAEAVE